MATLGVIIVNIVRCFMIDVGKDNTTRNSGVLQRICEWANLRVPDSWKVTTVFQASA